MAAPVGRTLLGLARGWRQLDRLWAGSFRGLSLEAAPSSSRSPWRLSGALCLQRPPLITKPLTPLQEEMATLLQQVEVERSLYSDHELRALEEDQRLAKKKSDLYGEEHSQEIMLAQDLEDMWEQAFLQFTPGARETEADKKNDRTSLHRKLDRNLVLLVREKLGDQDFWMLPQVEWQPGETLRGTAERILATLSGHRLGGCAGWLCVNSTQAGVVTGKGAAENNMEAKFLGNAPCGHYKFKFPKAIRTESDLGVKVFFFKALLLTGDFVQAGKEGRHVWASKEELGDYLEPKYLAQVRRFLMDL